jgi:hypothetical protein
MKHYRIFNWGYSVDFDLEIGPRDPKDFWFEVLVGVETIGEVGLTDYRIYVGTPQSLIVNFDDISEHLKVYCGKSGEYIFGRGLLLLREYNIDTIEKAIKEEVNNLDLYAFDVS